MFRLIEAPILTEDECAWYLDSRIEESADLATPQPRDQDHCHPALSRASSTCWKMFQGSIYKLQTEIPPLLKNVTACILERETLDLDHIRSYRLLHTTYDVKSLIDFSQLRMAPS